MTASARTEPGEGTTRAVALVATLLLRAGINGAFTAWLWFSSPIWADVFDGGAIYAIGDGCVGFLTAALLASHKPIGAPPVLVSITLADALLRVAAGIAILALPGIEALPITIVLLFGVLGAWSASAGAIAIVGWVIGHRHGADSRGRPRSETHLMFDPLAAVGLVALMMAAYALIVGPPATGGRLRDAAAVASGSFALVLLVASFSVARKHRPHHATV